MIVRNGVALEQLGDSRYRLVVIRTLSELCDCLLQTVHHDLTFITREFLLGALLGILYDLSSSVRHNLGDVCDVVSYILARRWRSRVGTNLGQLVLLFLRWLNLLACFLCNVGQGEGSILEDLTTDSVQI